MTGRARAGWLCAAAAASAAAWFALTAAEPQGESRHLFGLWTARRFATGCGLVWLAALAAAAARSRRALLGALFATILAGSSWALLELAGLTGLVSYRERFRAELRPPLGRQPVPHLDLEGETVPDIAAWWGVPAEPVRFHFETDRRGFRNRPDRADADLYLVGDSILVAGLLPFEDTLAARLEAGLGRPVLNVALAAIGPQEELERFRAAGLPVADRLVLHFLFEGNDLGDSARYRAARNGATREASLLSRSFAANAVHWLQRVMQPRLPIADERSCTIAGERYYFLWPGPTQRDHSAELGPIERTLVDFRAEVESAGGGYAVVVVPAKLRVLGPLCRWPAGSALTDYAEELGPLPRHAADWAARTGVELLDLRDALARSAAAGRIPWFPADTHLNALGHAAAAEALADWAPVRRFARE